MAYLIDKDLEKNICYFNERLSVPKNFNIIFRKFNIGNRNACVYMIDGFTKDEVMQKLLQKIMSKEDKDVPISADEFIKEMVSYGETSALNNSDEIELMVLMGSALIMVEGYEKAIIVNCKSYPVRSIEEPDKDRVLRGSRDGFVENVLVNTSLIRKRIRDVNFINENLKIGKSSATDVVLCYMENRVDKKLLFDIKNKLGKLKVDALTMNQESLAECLYTHKWINPFPKFKYSERPDTAAACILEGNIVILVDNSPAAMILPSSIFDIIEEANDYYFPPITGTYLRITRFITFILAIILTPLVLLVYNNPEYMPGVFEFLLPADKVNLPFIWQFIILEFAVDGLKLAAVNTPDVLTTPLSVIAGVVIGDFSVSSGLFNSQVFLFMAFVVLANYTQTSMELSYALKFMRLFILVSVQIAGIYGFIISAFITLIFIAGNKTIAGKNYLYPIYPFDGKKILERFFRMRIKHGWKE